MKKTILLITFLCFSLMLYGAGVVVKDKMITLKCTGISYMGSGITVDDAKAFAVNDAKRSALEQVGTYLESHMELSNNMVTKDEIVTYTAGVLKAEILKAENKVIEGTFAIEVTINATIDMDYLNDRLAKIKDDTELRKMLEEQKRLNDKLTKEINQLKTTKQESVPEKSKNIAKSLEAADYFEIGFKAQENGLYEEALKNYKKAIDLNPKIAQIYNNRGLVHYFMKDYAKAESNFDKAIELEPKLCMAYNNKAIIYYERRLFEQAIKYFNMVIELDPKLEQPYYNRGFAYYKLNQMDLCIKDLKTYQKMAKNKYGDESRVAKFIKDNEKSVTTVPATPQSDLISVPNLYNNSQEEAKKKIKQAGLVLGLIKSVTDEDKAFNRVIGQSLKKGEKVKKGAVIDITVNVEASGW
jgi:tetratricopeptide (TPR) repeat protein